MNAQPYKQTEWDRAYRESVATGENMWDIQLRNFAADMQGVTDEQTTLEILKRHGLGWKQR